MDGVAYQPHGLRPHRVLLRHPDEIEAAFTQLGLESQRLSRASGESWTATAQLGLLGFRATSADGQSRARGSAPGGSVLMQIDMGSDGPRRFAGRPIGSDDVGIVFGGAEFDVVTAEQHRAVLFSLPHTIIADAMSHRTARAEKLTDLRSQLILTDCAAQAAKIRRLVNVAFEAMDQPFGLCAPEFAYGDIVDALVGAVLSPWNRHPTAKLETAHYQRLPIVRRVEEFMRCNLGEPLTLRDLCAAARASERTVEYAFRDVYGVGAKQYLKLLRLNQVRRELKATAKEAAMVADIALRYGFWHMGHFSTDYRRLFGETPRQTRGQGQAASTR